MNTTAPPTPDAATATTTQPILQAQALEKTYRMGGKALHVLKGIDCEVRSGEMLAILGRSGSGKSTLLHLLGGLDKPDAGRVLYDGRDVYARSKRDLDRYRNHQVGFVFQFYHLLPELSALENVTIAAMLQRGVLGWLGDRSNIVARATHLLETVGLKDRMKHRPSKLSGGERQRVAIARAMINQPRVLLADEPTGNLDQETGASILELFDQLHAQGQTTVIVTHDPKVADAADRVVTLVDGHLAATEEA